MNLEQAKHLANSARAIGVAQFAAYGYDAMKSVNTDWAVVLASLIGYLISEVLAYKLLGRAEDG